MELADSQFNEIVQLASKVKSVGELLNATEFKEFPINPNQIYWWLGELVCGASKRILDIVNEAEAKAIKKRKEPETTGGEV